jgi:hypothetical protein
MSVLEILTRVEAGETIQIPESYHREFLAQLLAHVQRTVCLHISFADGKMLVSR